MTGSALPNAVFLQHESKTGDCLLDICVIPNAPQTKVDGIFGEAGKQALRLRLHAPPVDGKANEALLKWIAKTLGIAQGCVTLERGQTSRRKLIRINVSALSKARWHQILQPD